jgi:hypothetical protein
LEVLVLPFLVVFGEELEFGCKGFIVEDQALVVIDMHLLHNRDNQLNIKLIQIPQLDDHLLKVDLEILISTDIQVVGFVEALLDLSELDQDFFHLIVGILKNTARSF